MAQRTLKGVEIFRAGTWKGKPYTIADLDDIVSNFKKYQSGAGRLQRTPVVVGHDQKDLTNSSIAKRGDITEVWRDGEVLKTNADGVDEDLATAIEAGHYDDVSAEIYDEPPEGIRERGAKGKMLRRLAILGGDIPHLKGLNPAGLKAALGVTFAEPTIRITRFSRRGAAYTSFAEDVPMTREEMVAALVAAGGEAEIVNTFSDQQLAFAVKLKAEPAPVQTPATAAVTFSETQIASIVEQVAAKVSGPIAAKIDEKLAANAKELKRQRVTTFCESQLRDGRIDPADMDATKGPTLAERLMELDDSEKVHTFTEGGTKRELTRLDAECRAINLRPQRYLDNGKKVKSGKGGATTFAETDATVHKERFAAFAETVADEIKKTGQTTKDVVEAWELADSEGKRFLESSLGFAA